MEIFMKLLVSFVLLVLAFRIGDEKAKDRFEQKMRQMAADYGGTYEPQLNRSKTLGKIRFSYHGDHATFEVILLQIPDCEGSEWALRLNINRCQLDSPISLASGFHYDKLKEKADNLLSIAISGRSFKRPHSTKKQRKPVKNKGSILGYGYFVKSDNQPSTRYTHELLLTVFCFTLLCLPFLVISIWLMINQTVGRDIEVEAIVNSLETAGIMRTLHTPRSPAYRYITTECVAWVTPKESEKDLRVIVPCGALKEGDEVVLLTRAHKKTGVQYRYGYYSGE